MKHGRMLLRAVLAVLLLAPAATPAVMLATQPTSTLHDDGEAGRILGIHRDRNTAGDLRALGHPVEVRFNGLGTLDPTAHTLLIVTPTVGYGSEEVRAIHQFLREGGRVVVADDGPIGHELLNRLGAGVGTSRVPFYTPGFSEESHRVVALSTGRIPDLPSEGVLAPRPVIVEGGDPVLTAPELAWVDENDNGRPDLDEPLRSGLVIGAVNSVGDGEIMVLGTPTALRSASGSLADGLMAYATGGARVVIVDESHHGYSDPLATNGALAGHVHPFVAIGTLICTMLVVGVVVLGPRFTAENVRRRRLDTDRYDPALLRAVLGELDPK